MSSTGGKSRHPAMGGGHLLLRRGSAARLVWRPPSPSTAPGKNAWWCGTRQAKGQRIARMSLLLWLRVKKKKNQAIRSVQLVPWWARIYLCCCCGLIWLIYKVDAIAVLWAFSPDLLLLNAWIINNSIFYCLNVLMQTVAEFFRGGGWWWWRVCEHHISDSTISTCYGTFIIFLIFFSLQRPTMTLIEKRRFFILIG